MLWKKKVRPFKVRIANRASTERQNEMSLLRFRVATGKPGARDGPMALVTRALVAESVRQREYFDARAGRPPSWRRRRRNRMIGAIL